VRPPGLASFSSVKSSMRLKVIADIVKTAGKKFFEDDAIMRAAALAFYAVLSLAPLLVIFVAVTAFPAPRE